MEKAKKIVPEGWFKWERPGIDFPFYNVAMSAAPTSWHRAATTPSADRSPSRRAPA